MSYLYNDPKNFVDEMVEGFVAANSRWVRQTRGGVVRRTPTEPGNVAVIIGGGSGHYPAFSGLVGHGLASGAAMGNIFASPSADQIVDVATAADAGGGILLAYGNYAGDALNFTEAAVRLRSQGIPCTQIAVTDDVSSAGPGEIAKRRGVAGSLVVYKIAGAAADGGASLAEVARVASRANDLTRTIAVAFGGSTLPGSDQPLFELEPGTMAVGIGIHGEPGLAESAMVTADALAELFVTRLLEERPIGGPPAGSRVALVLNGLGSVKYEELFVVYRRVADLLREHGIEIVEPEVGEFVTSFEMAGASLSLCWLDPELESLWRAGATTPAFTKIFDPLPREGSAYPETIDTSSADSEVAPAGSTASQAAAEVIVESLAEARVELDGAVEELGRLDAIAGDGDHGIGMQRGITAAVDAATKTLSQSAGAATVLRHAGEAWANAAGGTSGALWRIALIAIGESLGDTVAPDARTVAAGVNGALSEIERFGKARVGDKTLVDALSPFASTLESAAAEGDDLVTAWRSATHAARIAADATSALVPMIGRARPHAEKSVGSPDPGAMSFALIAHAVLQVLERRKRS